MTDRLFLQLYEEKQAHQSTVHLWRVAKPLIQAGRRLTIELRPEKRSDGQNRRLWSMLTDVSQQVEWHGRKLDSESWKHIFSSALKKQDVVPNLDGNGFVVLGQSTSTMSKAEMSELLALIEAFGANHNVAFKAYGDQE